ncbi:MAG: dihydrofolate reductase family protein [Gaiellaceae bacterium]
MEPLELLFERSDLDSADLPDELERLYGGGIGLREPCLFSNFVSTIDGVVAIPSVPRSNALVADDSEGDRFVMGLLRALADTVLIGAGTLASSPKGTWLPEKVYPPVAYAFVELRRRLGRAERPQVAILTGHGSIDPNHPVLASGALVLTSDAGAVKLEDVLPDVASVVTLGPEATIDPTRVVEALLERGHRSILCEAGPHTHGDLLTHRLVDHLFLTISPLLAGDRGHMSRYGLAEAADLMPPGVRATLAGIRRHKEHVFLRYDLEGGLAGRP